jgi:uncharacterized protein (DUF885 family)
MTTAITRRTALTWGAAAAAGPVSLLSGCAQTGPVTPAPPPAANLAPDFSAWAESFAADWVRLSPERVTFSQYFSGAEQAAFESQLTPQTSERRAKTRELARAGLARLATFEAGSLTSQQRTEAATLRWSLERTVASEPYDDLDFVFEQMSGPQVSLVSFMSDTHPMRTPDDVAAFMVRLGQVGPRIDEAIALARAAAAKGCIAPRFILDRTRAQVQSFLKPPPEQNLFVQALKRRSETVEGLAADTRQRYIADATQIAATRIRPAWQRLDAFLAEIEAKATADAGLWRYANGAAAYTQALARYTTTTLTAEAIHAIGLREVARIEGEMDKVLQTLGRKDGTVLERMAALNASLQPPAEPDPRPSLIDKHKAHVADNIRRSQAFFNLLPKAPVEVRREPPLTEKTAAAHYTTPAPDGSRPGIFWAPLPGPVFNIAAMRSLAVHEAVPGHHYQLAIQQEQTSLPRWRQRRIFGGGSAHSEGWGLYAERLAIDNGWYDGDPVALLGALDSQLFRARRLVVDTGLHAKRWTREQAIAYGIGAQEVERYVVWPGQACAYMIGMLRMLQMREEARQAQGAAFDVKAFHDVLLTTGSVPLDVLADVIQRWTAERLAANKPKAA